LILNSIIRNNMLPFTYRYYALYNKSRIIRYSILAQQRNRCVRTGRVWMVLRKTQYSRFLLRTEAYAGNLPGCRRAS
jgi:ribosomal protein S14